MGEKLNLTPLKQRRVFNSWGMGKSLVMYFLIGLKKEIQNFTYPSGFMIVGSLKKKKQKKNLGAMCSPEADCYPPTESGR